MVSKNTLFIPFLPNQLTVAELYLPIEQFAQPVPKDEDPLMMPYVPLGQPRHV